ncbi:MAG: DUF5689 domain-containing protein [Bacteroidales bacterium]|nr:DUF5689 domain-containing protein [Bacteroidales bacterium]
MKIKTTILSIAALLLFSLAGCQKYDDPAPYKLVEMNSNMTIMEFKALHTTGPLIIQRDDIVLGGKVISTDKYGNFYRSFYIQDESGGIEIKIGTTGLYNTYNIGQWVYIKPYDLCLGNYYGMLSIGYRSLNPRYETAYIDVPGIINETIFRGQQSTPVLPVAIFTAYDITTAHYGTLVTIKNAAYMGGSYYLNQVTVAPWDKWAKKPDMISEDDVISEDMDYAYGEQRFQMDDGTTVVVRTSGYSRFADLTVPFQIGEKADLTGILTRYNNVPQLILNTDTDVVPAL